MRAIVLGIGEVASACAASLASNAGVKEVVMIGRDADAVQEMTMQKNLRAFRSSFPFPHSLKMTDFTRFHNHADVSVDPQDAVFLCTPVSSLFSSNGAEKPTDASLAASLDKLLNNSSRSSGKTPTLYVFTRGCSTQGELPAQTLKARFPEVRVVLASGPMFPKEWYEDSKRAGHTQTGLAARDPKECGGVSQATPPKLDYSSTSLVFAEVFNAAVATESSSEGASQQMDYSSREGSTVGPGSDLLQCTSSLFPRESVSWTGSTPEDAECLAVVNACAMLCAVGAGLVSNEYPSNVSALMSYTQHAFTATNSIVGRLSASSAQPTDLAYAASATQSNLSPFVASTLAMACNNFASREFAFGRRLDFYFKQTTAMQAMFHRGSSQAESLSMTVDGLYTYLSNRGIHSPFYEVIVDSYSTMMRASTAGKGLVRTGVYDYVDSVAGDFPLLKAARKIDDAMIAGDDEGFERAKRELADQFKSK